MEAATRRRIARPARAVHYRESIQRPNDLPGSMFRDFFLGFIKVHILHHAAEEPIYGLAMIEELRRHGYEISPGTIYPILHAMERAGLLARDEQLVDGRIRKYYAATPAGRKALAEVREKIRELVDEVLDGHDPGPRRDQPPPSD